MFLINFMESFAFGLLALDAKSGRTKHVSAQTCIALVIAMAMSFLNLPKDSYRKIVKLFSISLCLITGGVCTYQVAKNSDDDDSDDLSFPGIPKTMRKYIIYFATLVAGLLSLFVACKFSASGTVTFMLSDQQSTVCAFENFLHAFALLPQLVMSRRQGFVSPAAVRFLLIIGIKHLYEFSTDAYVSYLHYNKGKLDLHEFSFMSGDAIAAMILVDFLYMVAVDKSKWLLCTGVKELGLVDEEAMGAQPDEVDTPSSPLASILGSVKHQWADDVQRKKLLTLVVFIALASVGAALQLINLYAVVGAGAVYGMVRWVNAPKLVLPMHEKAEKWSA